MVRNGHRAIPEIQYVPPTPAASGVEVMPLAELRERMRRHGSAHEAQRPEFHLMMAVERGSVRHMVDFRDHVVERGQWLWVRPGQVQRFGDLAGASGWVVMFPPGSVPSAATAGVMLDDPFGPTVVSPGPDLGAAVGQAIEHLAQEYGMTGTEPSLRTAILQHLLAVLLLRLTSSTPGAASDEHATTFARFRAAVEAEFAQRRDVGYYARRLGYSPRTVTRAALTAAGIGAKEVIDRRVVLEAKRLLAHGEEPVATVAATLGFPDASNFVKFFSTRVGLTPAAFRRRFRAGEPV